MSSKTSTTLQDAIRLLYIFVNGAKPIDNHPSGYIGHFEGKAKLHAMDFWVRYPDFLAFELLNRYEIENDDRFLKLAKLIIDDQEPDLRLIPMIRYRFGAFEDLNESLSILISKGLIVTDGVKSNGKIKHYDYYVTQGASDIIIKSTKEYQILEWYQERSKLVKEISGDLGGSALKEIQYRHMSYANTSLGATIPSIKDEVIKRINKILESNEQ
ncbi:hypothetical protein [Myroides odoratus]|uniref:hypothetical protein n=1 Tax=Myroides odoratus TaxID=256 RepID=UPI0033417EB8